jgi:hypothetical protein
MVLFISFIDVLDAFMMREAMDSGGFFFWSAKHRAASRELSR